MTIIPGARLGLYEVLAPLGAGAMGAVWRARDTRLSREVAIKVLPEVLAGDRDRLARFEREAQVLASLNHPNIASIYGVEVVGAATALVLELVEGPTLEERIAQGPLAQDDAVAIARQIAEALEYAHEHGVVHRDLKPANVKIAPDGRVKVLDFGLAKATAPDAAGQSTSAISPTITSLGTIAGVVLGTPAYMAPEQARGAAVDRRADIWSFGVVLWEMLAGRRLFDDSTVSDTLAAVLRAPIEWDALPRDLAPGLVRLLRRCLERDPRQRLRDAGEARIALDALGTEPVAAAAPVAPAAPIRTTARVVPWILVAIALVFASAAAIAPWRKAPDAPPLVRFQIANDPRLVGMTWPRISPDGKLIAFLGRDTAGKTSIWIRPIDAFAAYELQDTAGASRPFWSPDSRYVAFFAARSQLKKAPVAGGPAQLIANAEGGADGSWGSAGEILFDGRAIDPIRRVSAAGGASSQATHPQADRGDAGTAWPYFLPDGRHFLYLAMTSRIGERAMLRVGSLDSPDSTDITPSDSRAEYANGHLLYVLGGTLLARPFDPGTLKLAGEPVPLAEHITVDFNDTASFSTSSNGILAYIQGEGTATSELVWLDRAGHELGSLGDPGPYFDLALSPDDTRLAYGFADASGAQDVWVRDLKRGVASRLTFSPRDDMWPTWSPDGRRIAFSSNREGHYALMTHDANGAGSDQPLYAAKNVEVGSSDWSRDGRTLALAMLPGSRRWDLRTLALDGALQAADYIVTESSEHSARFSPDGRYIAYVSNESGNNEVYVQTFPIGGGKWQISNGGGSQPLWRADGKEIFFFAPNDTFKVVPVSAGATFEPGIPQTLFNRRIERGGIMRNRWAVTADGQRFIVNAAKNSGSVPPFSVVLNWPAGLVQK